MFNQTNILFINDQYVPINPTKDTFTKLNNILSKIQHNKLKEYIPNKIIIMIMTSAYLAISFLKQIPLPENQLRIFLSYLLQQPSNEYLSHSQIYKGKKNRSKYALVDRIISEKDKSKHLMMKIFH